MKRVLAAVFSMLVSAASAGVGQVTGYDSRVPLDGNWQVDGKVLRWTDYPYNLIVGVVLPDGGLCTGQYVGRDLILTASHCAERDSMTARTADGRSFTINLFAKGYDNPNAGFVTIWAKDWALFRITDSKGLLPQGIMPFDVEPKTPIRDGIWSVGFGAMRVLGDDEIVEIQRIVVSALRAQGRILANPSKVDIVQNANIYRAIEAAFRPPRQPIWDDNDRLKLTPSCRTKKFYNQNLVVHDCDTVQGDSGGALVLEKGGGRYSVIGVHSGGFTTIGKSNKNSGLATRTELFYKKLLEARQSSP